jgi:hypothetical protein
MPSCCASNINSQIVATPHLIPAFAIVDICFDFNEHISTLPSQLRGMLKQQWLEEIERGRRRGRAKHRRLLLLQ